MKKHGLIIVIASIILVVLCVIIFAVFAKSRHNEAAKQAELDRQIAEEKLIEDATNKFKELFEMDLPDGVKVHRYYYSNDLTLIDLVFEEENYDYVFQTFQEKMVDIWDPIIFQKEAIYDWDDPDVYDFDKSWYIYPSDALNAACEDQVEIVDDIVEYYIDWYKIDPSGINGWMYWLTWQFCRDSQGEYHIMIMHWCEWNAG